MLWCQKLVLPFFSFQSQGSDLLSKACGVAQHGETAQLKSNDSGGPFSRQMVTELALLIETSRHLGGHPSQCTVRTEGSVRWQCEVAVDHCTTISSTVHLEILIFSAGDLCMGQNMHTQTTLGGGWAGKNRQKRNLDDFHELWIMFWPHGEHFDPRPSIYQ